MSMRDNSQGIENNITLTIPSSYYIMGDGNVHDIQALYYNYLSESEVPLTSFTTTDEVYEEQEPSSSNSDILADSQFLKKAICEAHNAQSSLPPTTRMLCTPENQIEAKQLVEALLLVAQEDPELEHTPIVFTNKCQGHGCGRVILPKVIRPGALVALGPPAMHIYNVITDALVQTAKYDLNWWINTQSPYNNLVQALNVDHQVFCSR
ncbi:hypothetical protein BT96DRAFT_986882 [Gymnopus androsaceus JB14]|uniref:Uncharacterized protein n=1 Tax=Gymnopus androsaceus JB14 TaxID=1447944 RepID=A0A6A4I9I0_9AGAR|nr:hypothetical protein BT96DRAFT_986882 [Gymnopus androsaceus JB14]